MRTSLIIFSLFSSPFLESIEKTLENSVLEGDYEKALKYSPERVQGDDLFFLAVACEEAGYFEKSYDAYLLYLNNPVKYADEAKIRSHLLGKKLMKSTLPDIPVDLNQALKETDPKKLTKLFQSLSSPLKTEIMIDRLIDLKQYALALKGPLTLTQEARLLYELGKVEMGPALLEKKKLLLEKLKKRSLPIDLYYIALLTRENPNSRLLSPYLNSRLIVELESDPIRWKEAFEESPNPFTLEKMALSQPMIAIDKMNEVESLKNDYLMGLAYLTLGETSKAEFFLKEAMKGADHDKALFAWIRLLDKKGEKEKAQLARLEFLKLPETPYHADASFELYSYRDYIYGEKAALKHLNQFIKDYPSSPLVLNAYYLLGLDYKHPRKRSHPRNLTMAADLFQEVETRYAEILIPFDKAAYYQQLKQEAILERAKTLMLIAEESSDAKRKIYASYAIDVIGALLKEPLTQKSRSDAILFWAKLLKLKGENPTSLIKEHLASFDSENKARAYLELAEISLYDHPKDAILYLKETETLPLDEKLYGKILKSQALEKLGDLDSALLTLSEVVNENGISQRRIEAMYRRACLYDKQGRSDLARRQLESCMNKGGEWALKASADWKEKYGHLSE